MRKFVPSFLISMCLVVLAALAMDVKVDYNHSVDFTQYKTYSWVKVKADPLWEDRIALAVDQELSSKGWTKTPEAGDVGLSAFGSTREVPTLTTFYESFGGGWYWTGFGDGIARTTVENTPIGTLVVDMFDSHTKKLIWRGIASDALSGKPEKDEKKLEKAVHEMFEHFPPKARG